MSSARPPRVSRANQVQGRVRVEGTRDVAGVFVQHVRRVLDVVHESDWYPNRGNTNRGRIYLDVAGVVLPDEAEPVTLPRGRCSACGSSYSLRADGAVRMHRVWSALHQRHVECRGSRQNPDLTGGKL